MPWGERGSEHTLVDVVLPSNCHGVLGIKSGARLCGKDLYPLSHLLAATDWVSCSPGWPLVRYIADGNLKPLVLLPLPPKSLDTRLYHRLWVTIPIRVVGETISKLSKGREPFRLLESFAVVKMRIR